MAKRITKQQYRDAANALHGRDGKCEIDSGAKVSRGDDAGAYVQAWVWVPDSAIPGHKEKKDG